MIGQFVTSKAGHDKGKLYVVAAEEENFVYLCDGRLKPLEAPKKKRRIHVQPVNKTVESGLCERLCGAGQVQNEEIKYAIKKFKEQD